MAEKKQRGVTLNAEVYMKFEEAAAAAGESVAAWLTKAGEARRRREVAEATVRFASQPEIASQLQEWNGYFERENTQFMAGLEGAA